jgi:hypothetical protein
MTYDVKMVTSGDAGPQLDHLVRSELRDPSATTADHVVVWPPTESMLVVSLFYFETHLLQNPAVNQQRERPVDRCLPDLMTAIAQQLEDLIGLKMAIQLQHGVENLLPRRGVLDPVPLEVLPERPAQFFRAMDVVQATHKVLAHM